MSNLNKFLKSFENEDNKNENIEQKEDKKIKFNKKDNAEIKNESKTEIIEDKKVEEPKMVKFNLKKNVIPVEPESPKTKQIEKNIEEKVKPNVVKEEKDILEGEDQVALRLFKQSETPEEFKEKWIELFKKAKISNKDTLTNSKVKRGKFRFNRQGDFEILPDHEIANKTSNNLLREKWD